ncbi:MAG: Sec-independent protein translocase protein TatB [Novosphingobium sp.]
MFDIGASELLLIVVVAIVVIGPKDMPLAMRTAGRWIGQIRRMSSHFRAGIDAMVREAELEESEREWRERNARIMSEHPEGATGGEPQAQMEPLPAPAPPSDAGALSASAESRGSSMEGQPDDEPQLPLGGPPPPP